VSCGVEFVHPLPSSDTIKKYYDSSKYHTGERYEPGKLTKKNTLTWDIRLKLIRSLGYEKGDIIDIGCATGLFLKVAETKGWNIKGLEISKNAAKIAKRILGQEKVQQVDLIDFNTQEKWDVATLWALIEHVTDPLKYLEKIGTLLRPGGLLALSTINRNSICRAARKTNWRYYNPPEHLFYFTLKSLSKILTRADFRIVKVKTTFNYKAIFKKQSKVLRFYEEYPVFRICIKLLFCPVLLMSKLFRSGDTMEIYAVKK
jgi:2-polyprenyl-3-methyl-5-hydroxy-6-metoxy-1,4-benzoquinol methylase